MTSRDDRFGSWLSGRQGNQRRSRHGKSLRLLGLALLGASLALNSLGCDEEGLNQTRQEPIRAKAIGPAECAACAMVVREQPAPRGQVIHQNGKRHYFCSLGDLVQYLQSPSPHGAVAGTFVETVGPDEPPASLGTKPRQWVKAEEASYLIGIRRPGVMGPGFVAYASAKAATQAVTQHGGRRAGWSELSALAPH